MSAPVNTARQYPVACPSCDAAKGFPYQVQTITDRSGSIEVKLRCRQCSHEWLEVVAISE